MNAGVQTQEERGDEGGEVALVGIRILGLQTHKWIIPCSLNQIVFPFER
jgi:hypothetical protein